MIKDLVNRKVFSVQPGTQLIEAAKLMKEKNIGTVLVCDGGGKAVGILTDRDLVVRCISEGHDYKECTVDHVMSDAPVTCKETDGIQDVILKMRDAKVRRMPVVDGGGRVIGILSFGDLLSVLAQEFGEIVQGTTRAEEYLDIKTKKQVA